MVCIYCGGETKVTNSRPQKRLNRVWRRRACLNCGSIFSSTEAVDLTGSIRVLSQKRLEAFQRDRLLLSIHDSLKHRKTAISDATGLTDTVIAQLYPLMRDSVVEKAGIASITLEILKRFDKTAATHYSAFHPH
jgi:transcriptional repressor NrdR